MARRFKLFTLLGSTLVVALLGCLQATPTSWGQSSPVISDDLDPESLSIAIRRSSAFLQKLPPDRIVGEHPRRLTAKDVLDSLIVFEKVLLDHWRCAHCFAREINEIGRASCRERV